MANVNIGTLFGRLTLQDDFTAKLSAADRALQTTGDRMRRVGAQMAETGSRLSLGVTAPLVAAGGAALKLSIDFESALVKIGNITDVGVDNIGRIGKSIQELGPQVGKTPKELAEAFTVIASTGMDANTSMEILNHTARAASVGLGETKDVARAVTAAMTAYGKEHLSAKDATDKLFAAVRIGGADADAFADSLGRVIGVSASVGVSFDEALASIATFTRLGVDADEAVTALRQTLMTFLNPSKEALKAFKELGTSIDEVRKSIRERGLQQTLQELVTLTHGNQDAISALFPNVRALAGVLANTGSQAEQYANAVKGITNAHDEVANAYARWEKTTAGKIQKFWSDLNNIGIDAGNQLAPHLEKLMEAGKMLLDDFIIPAIKWFASLDEGQQKLILGVLGLGIALGPVLYVVGNIVSALGGLAGIATTVMQVLGFAGAVSGGTVVAAVAAVGTGLWILYDALTSVGHEFDQHDTRLPGVTSKYAKLADELQRLNGMKVGSTNTAAGFLGPMTGGESVVFSPTSALAQLGGAHPLAPTAPGPKPGGLGTGGGGGAGGDFAAQLARAQQAVDALPVSEKKHIDAALTLGVSESKIAEAMHLSEAVVSLYKDATEAAAKATKEHEDDLRDFREEVLATNEALNTLIDTQADADSMAGTMFDIRTRTAHIEGSSDENLADLDFADQLSDIAAKRLADRLPEKLRSPLAAMAPAIMSALEGGGDVYKAAGSAFGGQLTENMFGGKKFQDDVTDKFGGALGGAFNALLPGLGVLLGPLLSKIAGFFANVFGGPDAKELKGRAEADDFRKSLEKTLTTQQKLEAGNNQWAQSFIPVRDAIVKVGGTEQQALDFSQQLWEAEKLGPDAVAKVIEQLSTLLTAGYLPASQQATALAALGWQGVLDLIDKQKTAVDALASSYGINFAAQTTKLVDDFNTLSQGGVDVNIVFAAMQGALVQYMRAMSDAGQTIPEAMQPIIDAFLAWAAANGVVLEGLTKQQDVLAKYGLDFAAQATKLIDDFNALVASGTDVNVVFFAMQDALTGYIQHMIQAGQEIPAAMQPIIDAFYEWAKANGIVLDSLEGITRFSSKAKGTAPGGGSGISWGGYEIGPDGKFIVKEGDEGGRRLNNFLESHPDVSADRLNDFLQSNSDRDQGRVDRAFPGAFGGLVTGGGIMHLAGGGYVGRDTVNAWLSPGEGVVNPLGMSWLGMDGLSALNAGHGHMIGGRSGGDGGATAKSIEALRRDLLRLVRDVLPSQLASSLATVRR